MPGDEPESESVEAPSFLLLVVDVFVFAQSFVVGFVWVDEDEWEAGECDSSWW